MASTRNRAEPINRADAASMADPDDDHGQAERGPRELARSARVDDVDGLMLF